MRNAFLVVVVLIATAAFQAALTPPFWISHNGTSPVFSSITSVYHETTSTNSTSTNFGKDAPLIANTSVIFNMIAFGLAIGTCAILTMAPLQLFLWPSLALFSTRYAVLASGIYPCKEYHFIPWAVLVLYTLPILTTVLWKMIQVKGLIGGDICYGYNLDEVKYLTFRSAFTNQGLILNRMAKRKASQ